MVKIDKFQRAPLVLAIATASAIAPQTWAQEDIGSSSIVQSPQIEEVTVQGRLRDSAEMLISERLDDEVVTDVLGSEMIGRVGDSTVAAALRRVSGLSLVSDKFVYVRGLGERYSSTTLNGAVVPSPDLTRNVIPLDIFPTSVVDSLAVQKSYSADQAATFGGGNVDIRTKGIPDQLTYSLELGTGFNSETSGDVMTYKGGDDDWLGTDDGTRAMSSDLKSALQRFRGDLGVFNIRSVLIAEGNDYASLQEATDAATALNRNLALQLNRDIAPDTESPDPEYDAKASVGNRFYLGDDLEIGFLASGSYKSQWRESERIKRDYGKPDELIDTLSQSTFSVDINGSLNLGMRYADEHEITTTSLYLRNTDDETSIRDYYGIGGYEYSSGRGFQEYSVKFEERDMMVHQIKGTHSFGAATKALIPGEFLNWVPEELTLDWFYSDSTTSTEIPNQADFISVTTTDGAGTVTSSSLQENSSAARYRFTDLEDEVTNYGWTVALPLEFSQSTLELSGGFSRIEKGRSYKQTEFSLGSTGVADDSVLVGPLDYVLSDGNITDSENGFTFGRVGNNQSYIAATLTEAVFGKVDWTLNETWRVSAGARWEDYNQVALEWNPYGYTIDDPQIPMDAEELEEATYVEDDIYPSLSLTYMGALWAETFQLRFGVSKTAVRPDLREITDAIYIDPITDEQVKGNPNVRPSEISNFDVRAEWFFDNGDNLTVSAYYKDITDPIEFFELASSDINVAREIINAESGEITGVEIEGMKSLGFLGEFMDSLFIQGNLTLQESELVAGDNADAPTNPEREMTGASEYVVNMLVGFDSPDGYHSATLGYNVFGERLYLAGRNGEPDAFEQPFHSLDLTYSWYPTQEITVKAKIQNLLDEAVEIERSDVIVFEEKPGQSFTLSAQYKF